jgi:hypothetical protein
MSTIGYALRAEYDGTVEDFDGQPSPIFLGGVLAVDGHDFDVRAELDKGNGTIVVDEANVILVNTLDEYAPLKRVSVSDDAPAITSYDERPVAELKADLASRGLATTGPKADLVARLTAADHGEPDPTVEPDTADATDPAQEA